MPRGKIRTHRPADADKHEDRPVSPPHGTCRQNGRVPKAFLGNAGRRPWAWATSLRLYPIPPSFNIQQSSRFSKFQLLTAQPIQYIHVCFGFFPLPPSAPPRAPMCTLGPVTPLRQAPRARHLAVHASVDTGAHTNTTRGNTPAAKSAADTPSTLIVAPLPAQPPLESPNGLPED